MNALAKHQALTHYVEQARIATLEQQRDALAKALRDLVDDYEYAQTPMGAERIALWVNARIVLTKLGDKP